jgi:hypothetical protein
MPWCTCRALVAVTAPDDYERCCLVIGGQRCPESTACRIAAEDGALADYTYTCARHADLVVKPGYVVTRIGHCDGEMEH